MKTDQRNTDMSHWKIPLFSICFEQEEINAVTEVMKSGWVSMGPKTLEFEQAWEEIYQTPGLAVSSCTAALTLALEAFDIEADDEVIIPSLTFVADANCVELCGAIPVFAEIESLERPVIDPEDIKSKITDRTKAVIAVHYAGYPADIKAIRKICDVHNLILIEDCAHSPIIKYDGKYLGTYGDCGCFSFFSNKNMTTVEGGMAIFNDQEKYDKARLLRSHGMNTLSWDKQKGHSYNYDVKYPGHNFRIDEMRSALGCIQLQKLPAIQERRNKLSKLYTSILKEYTDITIPFAGEELPSACHIYPIILASSNQRDNVSNGLKDERIQCSLHYPPIHTFTCYEKYKAHLPKTERYSMRSLTLPLYPQLSEQEVETVCKVIIQNL